MGTLITIPVTKFRLVPKFVEENGEQIKKYETEKTVGELELSVITSFSSHLKWEENFQKDKGNMNLALFTTQVSDWLKDESLALANFTDLLRWVYCFIDSDKLPNFSAFVDMLDMDNFKDLFDQMKLVLNEVGRSATKN
ncbi:MAG: hypothetical protein AB7E61_06415 [Acholeplasmataceae bacterium]